MSGHTPGPWEANEYSSPRGRWFIRQIGGLENINYPLNEANGRLIAAAPDLLEALIYARKELQAYEEALNGEDYNSPLINAAIAKATGAAA